MKTITTFNALHLGDNVVHLHFLRKLAQRYPEIHFTHGAPDQHLAQLYPLWQDLENLTVKSIAEVGQGAINAWCGAGGWWYQQPDTGDWCKATLRWFQNLARAMGLVSPFSCARDLLFDYPELRNRLSAPGARWNFLIVNAGPMSGQWQGHSYQGFSDLVRHLRAAGKTVITTCPSQVDGVPSTMDVQGDVTHIGQVSQIADCIIGCVTGPMWPCLNVWNADTVTLRIHLQDRERVDVVPERTVHANHLSLVPEILRERGLL